MGKYRTCRTWTILILCEPPCCTAVLVPHATMLASSLLLLVLTLLQCLHLAISPYLLLSVLLLPLMMLVLLEE